ncbi:MAG TPA: hypothetical protein VGH40_00210 [Roseiarcus sp.]|jgi:hypothetical protein
MMKPQSLMVLAAFALAACNSPAPAPQAAAPAPASTDVTPSNFQMPGGEGCVGDIARYRAIQDNDLAMGHVAQSVYNRIKAEIAVAEQQCSEGHEAQARATIIASRKRHGYPTSL